MLKYRFFLLYVLLIGIGVFGIYFFQTSYVYSYDDLNTTLFFSEDKEELSEKIKIYLADIDDLLIANSSFDYSDTLVYNYDFLLHFALNYVYEYSEYYSNAIKVMDDFSYFTKEMVETTTNRYVLLDEIYEITDKYFGIRDFEIVNDDVKVIDDYISLIRYTENNFDLDIQNVGVEFQDDLVIAKVFYNYDTCYVYTFVSDNQVLKIRNIEVVL